ncbi:helix-turn-helix domain-containing protein [Microbispora sp. NBC_01189]|uniref:helix-turn-helix domain-containing protein n=1 Tax=Microbispora sp. NBC_01189 TaxID=2903583 RepID=UPI002E0D254B|nr:helix-turn-helix domain-containing protein [Microbispora sp. NBC_01189]
MTTEDALWTTAEAAAYLRRPEGTLRQWRHKGVGPKGFRQMGRVVYRRSEVMRWLEEQERAEAER